MSKIRGRFYEAVRQAHKWKWKIGLPAIGVIVLAHLVSRVGLRIPYLSLIAWLVLIGVTAWWAWDRVLKPIGSQDVVTRGDEWMARNHGMASWVDILESAGRGAMRREAAVIRPSFGHLTWWRLLRTSVTEYAVPLLRAGWFTVHTPAEMWTLRVGGPRVGKSGSLASHCIDAPGALVCTSTRTDLLTLTGPIRSRKGQVYVFNPSLYGGYASTVRWSVLVGCRDWATCQRRAHDLIPDSTGEAKRWDDQARRLLALLLHAAAWSNRTVFDIVGWVAQATAESTFHEVQGHLRDSPSALVLMNDARGFADMNDRTLTSITGTLSLALTWASDQRASTFGDAPLNHPDLLDVETFVRRGTDSLYLVSPAETGSLAALTGALTAEIAEQARRVSQELGGRLDPPMTLVLDEAALACGRIPLDKWSSDMGGRGVTGHIGVQSLSQMKELWGAAGCDTILTNCGALVIFGGIKGAEDLEKISKLTGRRMMQVDDDDRRFVEVMDPAEIAALRKGRALVIRAFLPPVLGRVPYEAWKRRDVKQARKTWEPSRVDVSAYPSDMPTLFVPDDIASISGEEPA